MPIDLSNAKDLGKAASPRFFHTELTGDGKRKTGLLNPSVNAYNTDVNASQYVHKEYSYKRVIKNGNHTTTYIPTHPLVEPVHRLINEVPKPDTSDLFHIKDDYYLDLTIQGFVLVQSTAENDRFKHIYPRYLLKLYRLSDPQSDTCTPGVFHGMSQNNYDQYFTMNPYQIIEGITVFSVAEREAVKEYFTSLTVHDLLADLAQMWETDKAGEMIRDAIGPLVTLCSRNLNLEAAGHDALMTQLRMMETYKISLEKYRGIYSALVMNVRNPDALAELCKQNINLLMCDVLEVLENLKDDLEVPNTNHPYMPQGRYSSQQRAALSSPSPLTLVQAAAGTGKSTTIIGRIDYLTKGCKVDPRDITVLSFTNAAADNITERNQNVHAMTIASMIHETYALNYPRQNVSTNETLMNSLDIHYPTDSVAMGLQRCLKALKKNEPGSMAQLNRFIEKNFEAVVERLNRVRQTTLEIEIVIAYQKIDTLKEPSHITSRYLIVDEVQDTSVFEFIYLLKYVGKHKENLFMVGDSSQTLYEFRNADPRALNSLEASGVFDTYQLTTNYRSKQEILDMANVHLNDIEANQFAKMQMRANSLATSTKESFQESVQLDYRHVGRISRFIPDELAGVVHNTFQRYTTPKINNGEKVAFLAYSRRAATIMMKELETIYPDKKVVSLMSERPFVSTSFSVFVKHYWNSVTKVDPLQGTYIIEKLMIDNMARIVGPRNPEMGSKATRKALQAWKVQSDPSIKEWLKLYKAGRLTKEQYYDNLQQSLINHEIDNNAVRQSLTRDRNKSKMESDIVKNADILVSTVHGVKGLEFDHVVLVQEYKDPMPEDAKRLYYVAMTRAMKSEYILSYGTIQNPRIQADYDAIVESF